MIGSRCIGCGNCVRVCSQQAKRVVNTTQEVVDLLDGGAPVAACVAPSFPAAFPGIDYRVFVGMIRKAGFAYVHEVAFGADLVARRYRELVEGTDGKRYIATTCPSIVGFVERYHPELVDSLAPIVSPMVASARALKVIYGPQIKVVFIGPCIAKKCEAVDESLPNEVAGASTFLGLQRLFDAKRVTTDSVAPSDFDPPHANLGALFPLAAGMLQAARVEEDLVEGKVVSAAGRESFVEALQEFASGALDSRLLEILACPGCIMGPGMMSEAPLFNRRSRVSQYVRQSLPGRDPKLWEQAMERFADLELSRQFKSHDQRVPAPSQAVLTELLAKMGKFKSQDQLNCGACGYETCRDHAIAIYNGLAESKMCLPYTIDELGKAVRDLAVTNDRLAKTQEALVQSEKLASMGQLAAGIAHELNNPLGVVLMYAHLLLDESEEDGKFKDDLGMITEQADRCKKIVAGLLHFARQNKVLLEPTDVRQLVDDALRALQIPPHVDVQVEHTMADMTVEVDHDQMIQVLTNLISNACAAMPRGGTLLVRSANKGRARFEIAVTDTGRGIPQDNIGKIFEPFFTTKGMGKGTGLGLAVTYGIVKMHRGDIRVKSNADPSAGPTTTTFTVSLPKHTEE
ncbi:MAG: ATP-binding protein [Candidatus Hydrogenedentes bacterium]|nr:ATP-binding protein [Candidatus Hydrogenedentota bacterium]